MGPLFVSHITIREWQISHSFRWITDFAWALFVQDCSFPHLLGLYKFGILDTGAKGLTAHGSLADIALWAIFRMQSHVFASRNYTDVMRNVRERQAEAALQTKGKQQEEIHKQAEAALQHFRLRKERAQRIEKLKVRQPRALDLR